MQFHETVFEHSMFKIHEGSRGHLTKPVQIPAVSLCRLGLSLQRLLRLAVVLTLQLIRATDRDVLGTEVTEEVLQNVLDDIASSVVKDHQHSQGDFELIGEGNQAQLLVDLRDELGGTGESASRSSNQTPVHGLVLTDRLTERTTLVVDGKCGDLLDQLEEVDCAVQERGLEFALKINVVISPVVLVRMMKYFVVHAFRCYLRLMFVDVLRKIDQGHDMDGELTKHGSNDINVEDIWLGSLLRQALDRL